MSATFTRADGGSAEGGVGMSVGALIYDAQDNPTWRYRVEPFQHAVARSELTMYQIEQLCGWNSGYISRLLGLRKWKGRAKPNGDGKYGDTYASTVSYENAKRLASALHLDFVEWEI